MARGPRIGRPGLRHELETTFGGRESALDRVLIPSPGPGSPTTVRGAAADLAEHLRPLPRALGDIAAKVRRHCADVRRVGVPTDEALAAQLDALQARTWDLSQAVERLAKSERRRTP